MARNGGVGKSVLSASWSTPFWTLVFIVVSYIALVLPDHPGAFYLYAFLRFPLEIPLIALALLLLPRRLAIAFAALTTLAIFTLLFLKIADIGVQSAFQRRFNPYLDMKVLADGWNILSGAVGKLQAGLVIGAVLTVFIALLVLFFRSELRLARMQASWRRPSVIVTSGVLIAGSALWAFGPLFHARADLRALPYLGDRLALVQTSIVDMRQFEQDLAAGDADASAENLFAGIKGRDVVLVFVESYGRSAVEDPLYSPLIKPRLEEVQGQLQSEGFATASAWSRSPTMGGLSWLAHGTFLSGLWVDSQARYDRLMISDRLSLNRLFQKAGWRTAAIMPAITMDWPEASYFGYDRVFAAKDLEYKGKPFNWITMPDQYTLSAFERLVRKLADEDGQPLMAEMALISSHAPWTPVAKLIDWKDVGDGTAFNDQAESDEPPRVVWADRDNIRDHYIRTINYSLQTLGDYIAHFGEDAVFIILGDHQPAPVVTGPDASRAVPVHIISRDAKLIDRFFSEGFKAGMIPPSTSPELPMDTMRDRLVRAFGKTDP